MFWEIPGHLEVRNHELCIGGLSAEGIARKYHAEEGPVAVYNGDRMLENYARIAGAMKRHADRPVHVYAAVKANSSLALLQLLRKAPGGGGLRADAVSPNEGRLCLEAGFPHDHIKYTGTSVSNHDLDEAVGMGLVINCDSRSQIRRLAERHRPREVSIRWNPGEGAGETEHTITAGRHVKFGTAEEKTVDAFLYAMEMGLDPAMLHQHIGSNWKGSDVRVFLGTVDRTLGMAGRVIKAAKKNGLKEVDFGGGPGIRYHYREPSFDVDAYARGICGKLEGSGLGIDAIAIEPGRYIFGDAGILLSEVNTVEVPPWKGVPVVGDNTGFNHLVRPQMYGSYHHVVVCSKADRRAGRKWMIAGNLCESGDVRTGDKHRLRPLPTPEEGDVLAALNYGAYGFSMASEYNSRNLPAEVLVLGGKDYLIRERGAFVDLLRNQRGLPRLG